MTHSGAAQDVMTPPWAATAGRRRVIGRDVVLAALATVLALVVAVFTAAPQVFAWWLGLLGLIALAGPIRRGGAAYRSPPDLDPDGNVDFEATSALARSLRDRSGPDAEQHHRQRIALHSRLLGPDHPDTVLAHNDLARTLGEYGRTAEAVEILREVLPSVARTRGDEHPDTLSIRNNLAAALAAAGRPDEATRLFTEVLASRARELGALHPHTLSVRNNLAQLLAGLDRSDEAETHLRIVLDGRTRLLGDDDPLTASTRHGLAVIVAARGDDAEAERLFVRALTARRRRLGPRHPLTLATRTALAELIRRRA
ncbi:Flp pilus assembly protein TadD [Actinoalloteichus hoggarensis]|nr:tetratricopeptide repeat protein [Actinoalloteichus hoggarensis]MBB5922409.1 Flp pilus assembly protein TadD [Actinoalloteichus hoggarensis]